MSDSSPSAEAAGNARTQALEALWHALQDDLHYRPRTERASARLPGFAAPTGAAASDSAMPASWRSGAASSDLTADLMHTSRAEPLHVHVRWQDDAGTVTLTGPRHNAEVRLAGHMDQADLQRHIVHQVQQAGRSPHASMHGASSELTPAGSLPRAHASGAARGARAGPGGVAPAGGDFAGDLLPAGTYYCNAAYAVRCALGARSFAHTRARTANLCFSISRRSARTRTTPSRWTSPRQLDGSRTSNVPRQARLGAASRLASWRAHASRCAAWCSLRPMGPRGAIPRAWT